MEDIPILERKKTITEFKRVIIVQNGKQVIKSECRNCNLRLTNNKVFLWRHWKYTCPLKLKYVYINSTKVKNKLAILCTVCKNEFETTAIEFMRSHRNSCRGHQNNGFGNILPKPNNSQQFSAQNSSTSQVTIPPARTIEYFVDLDRLQFWNVNLKISGVTAKELAVCQHCKLVFEIDFGLLVHRAQCKTTNANTSSNGNPPPIDSDLNTIIAYESKANAEPKPQPEPELLSGVQTEHTIAMDNTPNVQQKVCFVCGTSNNEPFVSIIGTATDLGNPINDVILKVLNNEPNMDIDDINCLEDDVICTECLNNINQYDASHFTAEKYKNELCQMLALKESNCEILQNQSNIHMPTSDQQQNNHQSQQIIVIDDDDYDDV